MIPGVSHRSKINARWGGPVWDSLCVCVLCACFGEGVVDSLSVLQETTNRKPGLKDHALAGAQLDPR